MTDPDDDDYAPPRPSAIAVLVLFSLGAMIGLGFYMLGRMLIELGRAMPLVIEQAQLLAAG